VTTELGVLKNSVVTEMFVDTADQNYLIARWAYHRGMYIDFFWNAVHALEKYLKASLLLNGYSSKRNSNNESYGHDLTLLFDSVCCYAQDLFPETLQMPKQFKAMMGDLHWKDETPHAYLERLYALGEANNRYNIFGYTQRWEDLFHFDQMVFHTRRVAFELAACPFLGRGPFPDSLPKTVRQSLERQDNFQPRGPTSRLYKLLGTKGDDELRDAGLKLNFRFAPPGYDHQQSSIRVGTSASDPVLHRRIVARAESMAASSADKEAADLSDWVVENITLPGDVKNQLREHAQVLRNRSSGG